MLSNKLFWATLLLFCLLPLLRPAKTLAIELYQGPCSTEDGNHTLVVPYKTDGRTYDCARNENNGDTFPGGAGPCFAGAPAWSTDYGLACIYYEKITIGAPATKPKFVKNDCEDAHLNANNCGIVGFLVLAINTLSAVVGVVIVLMIIVGGIQYTSAGDDPQKVQAAKGKITNALLALFLFIFMYGILQWLVPGGIF